jgi:hypothetical protein
MRHVALGPRGVPSHGERQGGRGVVQHSSYLLLRERMASALRARAEEGGATHRLTGTWLRRCFRTEVEPLHAVREQRRRVLRSDRNRARARWSAGKVDGDRTGTGSRLILSHISEAHARQGQRPCTSEPRQREQSDIPFDLSGPPGRRPAECLQQRRQRLRERRRAQRIARPRRQVGKQDREGLVVERSVQPATFGTPAEEAAQACETGVDSPHSRSVPQQVVSYVLASPDYS